MKAIILCGEGEEGLAPLTLERPLPLLSLFDKPLLAHQAGLLRRHGVREIGGALPRPPPPSRPPPRGVGVLNLKKGRGDDCPAAVAPLAGCVD